MLDLPDLNCSSRYVIQPGHLALLHCTLKVIERLRTSTSVPELQSFLGLCNAFRGLVPNFPRKAASLTKWFQEGQPYRYKDQNSKALEAKKPRNRSSFHHNCWHGHAERVVCSFIQMLTICKLAVFSFKDQKKSRKTYSLLVENPDYRLMCS